MHIRESLDAAWRDLRLAFRTLRRTPAFTVVAVASLAFGIGANAAMFSVLNAVLLRPLPYRAPDRLVSIETRNWTDDGARGVLSAADLRALLEGDTPFSTLGAYAPAPGGITLTGLGEAEQLTGSRVSSGAWRALGVAPVAGRLPVADEDVPNGARVVVLSHPFWRDRFASSPSAIGRSITLDGEPHTIVGVMPPGFTFPRTTRDELWPVLQLTPPEARAPFWLSAIGRLDDGATLTQARTALTTVATTVKRTYPDAPPEWSYEVIDLKETIVQRARATVLILHGAVALVLLLAAANVANLFLARATVRGPELAVRTALGAGRAQLARQLLAESLLVATSGGALGLALAWGSVRGAAAALPTDLPRLHELSIDGTVLLFALAVTLVTGLLVGIVPAIQVPRRALAAQLREGGRSGADAGGAERRRLRSALVVGEFAVAVTVLIGAGLVVNSLLHLQRVDAGAPAEGVVTMRLAVPEARYKEHEKAELFFDEVTRRIAAIPGVLATGISMAVPPDRLVMTNPYTPEGKVYAPGESAPLAEELLVSPGYFSALRIPIRRGRSFADADREGAPLVAIVNETFAKRHFAGGEAVGRWLQTGSPDPSSPRLTIVGVVPDVKYQGLDAKPQPTIYVPWRQNRWWRSMFLVVRTAGTPTSTIPAIRGAVQSVDPEVPLRGVRTMEQLLHESVAQPRFRALLLAGFALVALLLASAGIYGVMSYDVSQRRREMGVHLALGAPRRSIVRRILVDGMRLAAAGVALGVALALVLTRLMQSVLFGVSPLDPATFAVMALSLALVGAAACAIPALRASRTDPMLAMRGE